MPYADPEKKRIHEREKYQALSRDERRALAARRDQSAIRASDKRRDPVKVRARALVRQRICRGTMERGQCEVCGDALTHAHHDDYSKPTEVRWLCRQHHDDLHRRGAA